MSLGDDELFLMQTGASVRRSVDPAAKQAAESVAASVGTLSLGFGCCPTSAQTQGIVNVIKNEMVLALEGCSEVYVFSF